MSGKHKRKQAAPPSPEPNPPTELFFAYANFVSVTVGLYDMQLEFGIEMDGVRTPTARIAMSPQHAVSLQLILARLLKEYETNVGPIALPAEVRERLAHGQTPADGHEPGEPS